MNILFIGDIVGKSGRDAFSKNIGYLKNKYKSDVIIVNAENSAAGYGLTKKIAIEFEDSKYTYSELDQEANKIANWAIEKGYKTGDVISLLMENKPEFIFIWLGLSKLGVTVACLNNNIKLVYSATSASLGNNGNDKNLSPYAFTKSKNLELLENLRKWFNLKFEIIYFYNVYGPGQIKVGDMATVVGIFEEQ